MNTALEALFRDMLNDGWFTNSDGSISSPFGYFGYVTNEENQLLEIYEAFRETVDTYGMPEDKDIIGSFVAYISDDGSITIERMSTEAEAKLWFDNSLRDYLKWHENYLDCGDPPF